MVIIQWSDSFTIRFVSHSVMYAITSCEQIVRSMVELPSPPHLSVPSGVYVTLSSEFSTQSRSCINHSSIFSPLSFASVSPQNGLWALESTPIKSGIFFCFVNADIFSRSCSISSSSLLMSKYAETTRSTGISSIPVSRIAQAKSGFIIASTLDITSPLGCKIAARVMEPSPSCALITPSQFGRAPPMFFFPFPGISCNSKIVSL